MNAPDPRTRRICAGCKDETETTRYVTDAGRIVDYCPVCAERHRGRLETVR